MFLRINLEPTIEESRRVAAMLDATYEESSDDDEETDPPPLRNLDVEAFKRQQPPLSSSGPAVAGQQPQQHPPQQRVSKLQISTITDKPKTKSLSGQSSSSSTIASSSPNQSPRIMMSNSLTPVSERNELSEIKDISLSDISEKFRHESRVVPYSTTASSASSPSTPTDIAGTDSPSIISQPKILPTKKQSISSTETESCQNPASQQKPSSSSQQAKLSVKSEVGHSLYDNESESKYIKETSSKVNANISNLQFNHEI